MKIKICVLFGGRSVEHEVSIITALQAINNIDKDKYEVVPIYIDKEGKWYTGNMLLDIEIYKDLDLLKRYAKEVVLYRKDDKFVLQNKKGLFKTIITDVDLAFPIMHGTNGEDGSLQGYLETIGIPYCESDVYACVLGQDKIFQKQVLRDNEVNVVKYKWFFDKEYLNNSEKIITDLKELKYPLIIKPSRLGSSVGINIAHDEIELRKYIDDAILYDNKILVEEVVNNLRELNISVLGNSERQELSVIEEVGSKNELLTYEDKYIGGKGGKVKGIVNTKRLIPADVSKTIEKEVKDQALKAFRALNFNGVVRIDFLVNEKTQDVYVNEVNTIPGSLSFYLWEHTNKDYRKLLNDIINLGVLNYKEKKRKITTFKTNILEGFDGLKGIKK